jgi:hypothetical protein
MVEQREEMVVNGKWWIFPPDSFPPDYPLTTAH